MAARLTDRKKKRIIADYLEMGSYAAVGKKHGVSHNTVRRVVQAAPPEFAQKVQQKKNKNTEDILAHMETKRDKVNQIIDVYLERLLDPETLAKATPSQLTTALGTLIDKFTMPTVRQQSEEAEDDALTQALREEAERMQQDANKP